MPTNKNSWSQTETSILCRLYQVKSDKELAERLPFRTLRAVQNKMASLKLRRTYPDEDNIKRFRAFYFNYVLERKPGTTNSVKWHDFRDYCLVNCKPDQIPSLKNVNGGWSLDNIKFVVK